ncbi:hypothetical protein FB466_0398 [Klugiella xanthotipulae]|uniref:Uncharacterized protein n=1 Tax=Klugiella xanthotipulae TaxID=244735 RepID=A0A543I4R9_9MICO|nr:hypothetical protein FB466_0398 [Klugiella xanthotipulae]
MRMIMLASLAHSTTAPVFTLNRRAVVCADVPESSIEYAIHR